MVLTDFNQVLPIPTIKLRFEALLCNAMIMVFPKQQYTSFDLSGGSHTWPPCAELNFILLNPTSGPGEAVSLETCSSCALSGMQEPEDIFLYLSFHFQDKLLKILTGFLN